MTALGGIAAALLGGLGNQTAIQNFQVTTGGTANMAYNPVQTWQSWNNCWYVSTGSFASTAGNDTVWAQWCSDTPTNVVTANQMNAAQVEAWRQQALKSEEEARTAQQKAEALLLEHLSPAQRETYAKHGLFIVETPKKRRYQLAKQLPPYLLEGERRVVSYCIHTRGVPRADELLGFKLLLEANEDQFLSTANATRFAA